MHVVEVFAEFAQIHRGGAIGPLVLPTQGAVMTGMRHFFRGPVALRALLERASRKSWTGDRISPGQARDDTRVRY